MKTVGVNRYGDTLRVEQPGKVRAVLSMPRASAIRYQAGVPELTLPSSKALRAFAQEQRQPAALAKVTKHKPGRCVQGGGATGSNWTAYLVAPDGKEVDVSIVALSQLAATAIVRRAYPRHTVVKVR